MDEPYNHDLVANLLVIKAECIHGEVNMKDYVVTINVKTKNESPETEMNNNNI
jgi:hypothetical protein